MSRVTPGSPATPSAPRNRVAGFRRVLVGLTVLVAMLLPVGAPFATGQTLAQQDEDNQFVSIDIDVVGSLTGEPNRTIDVAVHVSTKRAVSGRLVVVDSPNNVTVATWEFDIDQAADTTTTLPVVLTSGWQGLQGSIVVESLGQVLAERDIQVFPQGRAADGLVATVGIAEPPRVIREIGSDDTLTVVNADTNLAVLGRASSVIATPEAVRELAALPAGQTLQSWLRGGGQLIVDGPTGSLDDSFHQLATANPARFLVGAGSVLYDTDWLAGIPLGGYIGHEALLRLVNQQGLAAGSGAELALLADLGLPRPAVVTAVLLAYAVIAGPLLFFITARRRAQRRLWILLPLFAIAVAAALLIAGLIGGRSGGDTHITIIEVHDQGSRATSNLLVSSRFGGSREIVAPAGWRYLGPTDGAGRREVRLRPETLATRVALDLPPRGTGGVRMAGPAAAFDRALEITDIRGDGQGGVTANVVNNTDADLVEAVAFLGNERSEIGAIAAGESVEFSITARDVEDRMMRELLLWPRVRQQWTPNGALAVPVDTDDPGPVSAGAWTQWRTEQGTGAIPPHTIGVAGWTDSLMSPVADLDTGNTALFVREPLPGDLFSERGFSTVFRPFDQQQEPIIENGLFGWHQDYRFTLANDRAGESADDQAELALAVGDDSSGIGILVDGRWQYPILEGQGGVIIALPEGAIVDGEIVAQSLISDNRWNAGQSLTLVPVVNGAPSATWSENRQVRGVNNSTIPEPFEAPTQIVGEDLVELVEGEPAVFTAGVNNQQSRAYLIEVEAGQSLTITMRSPSGDSYLELFDIDGSLAATNDDFGEGVDSRIDYVASFNGTIEVRAQGLGGQQLDYELTIEVES